MNAAQNLRAKIGAGALALGTAVMASPAMAADAAIDVTPVVAKIEATTGPIGLIGLAVLGVIVAIAAFGYVRRAIRG